MQQVNLIASTQEEIKAYLIDKDVISSKEEILTIDPYKTTGLHAVVRIETTKNAFILKQPKYNEPEAKTSLLPLAFLEQEAKFYTLLQSFDYLARFMPELHLFDQTNEVLVFGEIAESQSFQVIYKKHFINNEELRQLIKWLSHLHRIRIQKNEQVLFQNNTVKEFCLRTQFDDLLSPKQTGNSPYHDLLFNLKETANFQNTVLQSQELYNKGGFTLLHGNYSPANWLASDESIYIIDPKNSSFGIPEVDLACILAHFYLASLPIERIDAVFSLYEDDTINKKLVMHFAGLEIIRSLEGFYPYTTTSSLYQKKIKLTQAIKLLNC